MFRQKDKDRLWIYDSVMKLSCGENVDLPDSEIGDILELVWSECLRMEKKNQKASDIEVGDLCAAYPAANLAPIVQYNTVQHSTVHSLPDSANPSKRVEDSESPSTSSVLDSVIEFWNSIILKAPAKNTNIRVGSNIFQKCISSSPSLVKAYNKRKKEGYKLEQIQHAIREYARERCSREPDHGYAKHKFSLHDFIKQENGLAKYINSNQDGE